MFLSSSWLSYPWLSGRDALSNAEGGQLTVRADASPAQLGCAIEARAYSAMLLRFEVATVHALRSFAQAFAVPRSRPGGLVPRLLCPCLRALIADFLCPHGPGEWGTPESPYVYIREDDEVAYALPYTPRSCFEGFERVVHKGS